jgi:hypothetical protein
MRQSRTFDWIEQAEANRLLTDAAFEAASLPSWRETVSGALVPLSERLRGWLLPPSRLASPAAALPPVRCCAVQPQPARDNPSVPAH